MKTNALLFRKWLIYGGMVFLLCPGLVLAQSFNPIASQFYSINNGLSDRLVTDIIQPPDGFIWLATANGLNKFDGYDFIIFNNNPDNPNQISDINIDHLALDKHNNIVIVYTNNLFFFDLLNPFTHQVIKVKLNFPESGIKGIVRQISVNKKGEILVLSTSKDFTYLHRYEGGNRFSLLFQIPENKEKQSGQTSILALLSGNYLLADSEKGLRLFDHSGKPLETFMRGDFAGMEESAAYPAMPSLLYEDAQDRIWLAFSQIHGFFKLNKEKGVFEKFKQMPDLFNYSRIWEDQQGNLLVAQTKGNNSYPDVLKLFSITKDQKVLDYSYLTSIGSPIVCAFSEDFSKTILFGIDTGLKIVQNSFPRIKTFLAMPISEDRRGHIIRGITSNGQKIYFAEEGGAWYSIDIGTDRLDTIKLLDKDTDLPIDINCTLDVLWDDAGYLWGISCNNLSEGQLHRYDPATKLTETFRYKQRFEAFTRSKDGIFWLLSESEDNINGSLVSFDPNTKQFTPFSFKVGEDNSPLKNATPLYIMESRDGMLWIGSSDGLIKVDRHTGKSILYQNQSDNNAKSKVTIDLKSNNIYVIYEDDNGLLWLGTSNGLNIFNPKTGEVKAYTQSSGLASNTVCGIVPDKNGNYWISTYNGLSYFKPSNFDPSKIQFHNFFQADGLSHDEFDRFSFYQDANGRYYFGGVNGLNTFYADQLLTDEKIPTVALTKLVRYNRRSGKIITQYHNLDSLHSIEISPYDTYFQLYFMLPKFKDPQRNLFKSWLEGYEKGWSNLGTTPYIRYNSLPADTYILHIKGADPNGNWSAEPLSIKITVRKVFYRTKLFLSLCIIVIAAIIYWFFRYQWIQKLQVERFRTKLSSDLHDELSGLLSGIAMQTDMLQMSNEDATTKSRLRHIGEVSRKAMSKMSDVIWSIDSRKDKMEDLIHRMREHADDILLPLNIQYTFEEKKIDPQHRIPPTIRQELYLIFKESINNIVKHSNANKVSITLNNSDGLFQMEIKDNGKGIPKHNGSSVHSGSGQGLSNIKMRAQRINAKVDILKDEGYTVLLKMRRFA